MSLVLRNVRPWGGEPCDIALAEGTISHIAPRIDVHGLEFDGCGATLLPGLHDHHIHLLATAARANSIDLTGLTEAGTVALTIADAARVRHPAEWLRAVGFDERAGGLPDSTTLDAWAPAQPLRVQDRTGALWVLNRAALGFLRDKPLPPGCERGGDGQPTGRFWREDRWLGEKLPRNLPDVAALGRELAGFGVTGLTDAGAHNGPVEAAVLGAAGLSQRLTLMGGEALEAGPGYRLGPLKLLIDERDPPDLGALAARIAHGRARGRPVAAHCATALELALFLAALDFAGGARKGDRIEHGGEIGADAIPAIAATSLTVVTNPGFVHDRGDRYCVTIPEEHHRDIYRAASLIAGGIPLAAGSDAPYANRDPWLGMRTARERRTMTGQDLGRAERIDPRQALALYLGEASDPGGPARPIAPGAPADLVLCEGALADVLADLTAERVRATFIAGQPAFMHN